MTTPETHLPDNPEPGSLADQRRQERLDQERTLAKEWLAYIRSQLDQTQ